MPAAGVPEPTGLELWPFPALRYDVPRFGTLDQLTSPPFDVLDGAAAAELAARSRHNIVRLILPRDAPGEPGSRYRVAGRLLAAWRADGVLAADPAPALYVYEERDPADGHVQRGLVGAVGLVRPEAGIVLPHENTMSGTVADRLALTEATGADLEPIVLLYDGGGAASDLLSADLGTPLLDGPAGGLHHRVWAVRDSDRLAVVAADLLGRRAMIADGHHRYATYLAHQRKQHAAGRGSGPWDRGLVLLVDASVAGPRVGAIHRVLAGVPLDVAVERARASALVRVGDAGPVDGVLDRLSTAGSGGRHAFALAAADRAVLLTDPDAAAVAGTLDPARSPAWAGLDATVAHHFLLPVVLGIEDREDVVGYEHSLADAIAAAARRGGCALLLNPTPSAAVLAVAAAGERMPRKSTLFTPKPRSGLLMRVFDLEL